MPIKYIPVKSYAAAVAAFRNDQVQLAWFGGLSGVRARTLVPGSQAIAAGLKTKLSLIILLLIIALIKRSDKFPMEIAGKIFTFGSKGSTSGASHP